MSKQWGDIEDFEDIEDLVELKTLVVVVLFGSVTNYAASRLFPHLPARSLIFPADPRALRLEWACVAFRDLPQRSTIFRGARKPVDADSTFRVYLMRQSSGSVQYSICFTEAEV